MTDRTYTELEVYCQKMGWDVESVTKHDVESISPKRYREGRWDRLVNSTNIWKSCDVCGHFFVVNHYPDHKPRTPRLVGFVLCTDCDPRHREDRLKTKGYRILHPNRARVVKMAQVTRLLTTRRCETTGKKKIKKGCKCAVCTAKKLGFN